MPRPLLLVLALCGVFAACDSTRTETPEVEAGVEGEAGIDKVECPKAVPARDAPCALPEGTTCDFGACGTKLAVCTHGLWSFGGNPAPNPPCPGLLPGKGEACPACWPEAKPCPYHPPGCFSEDASDEQRIATASCVENVWAIAYSSCPLFEGGADVQRDAGPDGD